jgi:hypothetical protein
LLKTITHLSCQFHERNYLQFLYVENNVDTELLVFWFAGPGCGQETLEERAKKSESAAKDLSGAIFDLSLGLSPAQRKSEEWLIREAAFRYVFENRYAISDKSFYALHIIELPEIPKSFVSRFKNTNVPIYLSDQVLKSSRGVYHPGDETLGMIVSLGTLEWKSATTVNLRVSYYKSEGNQSGEIYHLEKRNGGWVVFRIKQ